MEHLGSEAERYLRAVVEGQPIWVRKELEEELRGHLAEAIGRRMQQGADAATAQREALEALGPAAELRRELARVRRPGTLSGDVLGTLAERWLKLPIDVLAPIKLLLGRPRGNFGRDYELGRYDAIIARGEHELRTRGPRYNLHHELGLAYNAIGEYDRALEHLQAEVAWVQQHPCPRLLGRSMTIATAYSNLAGVLERLGRDQQAAAAIQAGLAADARHGMLHLQRAQQSATTGDRDGALRDLTAVLDDGRLHGRRLVLLLAMQDPRFDVLRDDPQFSRLRLRAVAA